MERNQNQVSMNSISDPTILLIDSHKCILLTQSPAICYRNHEEPEVHCTGSGEAHWRVKHYHSEAEVNLSQPVKMPGTCRSAKV
jgi:hypothetical protein